MKTARAPLLSDLYLADKAVAYVGVEKGFAESTRTQLLQAKKFVLTDEAVKYLAKVCRDNPRIIADAYDYAIPPFETMWVEFDNLVLWREMHPEHDYLHVSDTKIGFLYSGNTIRSIIGSDTKEPMLSFIEYKRNTNWDMKDELEFAETVSTSRLGLDQFFWGSAYGNLKGDSESLRVLRANNTARFAVVPEVIKEKREAISRFSWEFAGDLRNMIAMLIFLNRTVGIQEVVEYPHKQAMIKNKVSVLQKHSVINININPDKLIKKICAGVGHSVWKRLHDVRGHFCHDKTARESACNTVTRDNLEADHDWSEVPTKGDTLQWECKVCGGLRWWRKEHKRGFEEKGTVTSEYKVTA